MGFSLSSIGDVFEDALGIVEDVGFFTGDVLTGGALSQRKASKEQQRAIQIQARTAAVQNARKRRQAIAAGRRAAATATAGAASTGGIGSSGLAGFQAGTTTTTAANVSFQRGLSFLESQRLGALSDVAKQQGRAALAAGVNTAIQTGARVATL